MSEILLSARGLKKTFGGAKVLDGFDLDVTRGEIVALIGPSGAGKTTALRCLNLLETPDAGDLVLGGVAVPWRTMGPHDLGQHRQRVGMVFQHFHLFGHMNALANLIEAPVHVLGQDKATAMRLGKELLESVGLGDRAQAFPAELSGGQQQRVAIARSLAMSPDVLLLDEVTSALDVENIAALQAVLRTVADSGVTLVMVTHDLSFAKDTADRLCFVGEGRVLEEGPAATLLEAPKTDRLVAFLGAPPPA